MAYPILAANSTWYKSSQSRTTITQINIVDSYTPTGSENETWNADTGNSGSIKCYRTGTVLTIAGNGSGKIAMNADSSYAFSSSTSNRFSNLVTIAGANLLDASNATSFERLFYLCKKLKTVDVSNWQTGNVTNMNGVFNQALALEQIAVENWDTSSCENMAYMFQLCIMLNSLDLSKWDVSKVQTMQSMFMGHSSIGSMAITSINVSGWNTGEVRNMSGMFQLCHLITEVDVSNWNTSKVENMQSIFNGCSSLTTLDVSNWDTSNLKNMSYMFIYCTNLETLDVSNWDTSSCTDMTSLFEQCKSLAVLDVSNWDTSSCTDMTCLFRQCESLVVLDVSDWDVSKVTSMKAMFNCGVDYGTNTMSYTALDVSKWNTSSCTDMSFMFYGVDTIGTINVSNWDVSKVTNFDHLFAHSYASIGDISSWKNTIVENLGCTFHSVQNEILNLSGFTDTSKCISFRGMFKHASNLTEIIGLENFDTSTSVDFQDMFYGCTQIKELNLSSFDTRNAKDGVSVSANGVTSSTLGSMFYNMPRLEKITLGENFSFNGDGTTTDTSHIGVLPTPDATYITGADGKWYTFTLDSYAPTDVPSLTANTYYGSLSLVRDADVLLKNGTIIDIAAQIKEKTGKTDRLKPSAMASEIAGIESGGIFTSIEEKDVNFYDYDGTCLYSYTLAEAMELTELPPLPEHDGLTCQKWNWTLAEIKALPEETLGADIGAVYITSDGKTHCYFEFVDEKKLDVTLNFTGTLDIEWGDGTTTSGATSPIKHTYANKGTYLAKLYSASAYKIGGGTSSTTFVSGNAHALKRLHLASNCTLHSGGYALYGMYGLESVTIHTGETYTAGINTCYSLRCIVLAHYYAVGLYGLQNSLGLRVVCLPSSTHVQMQGFRTCSNLRRFAASANVVLGETYHFHGCYTMREVYLTNAPNYVCGNTYALRKAILKDGITNIGTGAFYASGIETLRLPSTVTSIDANAFTNCTKLDYLEFNSSTPPTVANSNAFTGIPASCIVKVPAGTLATYQAETNYSTIAAQMVEVTA